MIAVLAPQKRKPLAPVSRTGIVRYNGLRAWMRIQKEYKDFVANALSVFK